jgi:hypothetical protein
LKIRDYARVVIDGIDGSGKSTLTKQVLEYLGDRAYYVPGYNRVEDLNKPPMEHWWMHQLAYNPPDKVIVHDRFFYPELVYGPVLRGTIASSESTRDYVHRFLRYRGFLIYCRPGIETLQIGVKSEPQMKGVVERFDDLLTAYDNLMIDEAVNMGDRFFRYNWTNDDSISRLFKALAGYLYQ